MTNIIRIVLVFLQVQFSESGNRYCPEAVASVKNVLSCPHSEEEWDSAARQKNCSRIAARQNCSADEKFQYHCVINGYRNETLEVCAPSRIIFGHCVEFNVGGGVIQDQVSTPCNSKFPKCAKIYHSTKAYKYPDCYNLVSRSDTKPSSTTDSTSTVGKSDTEQNIKGTIIGIVSAIVITVLTMSVIVGFLKLKRNFKRPGITITQGERISLMSSAAEKDCGYKEDLDQDALGDTYLHYKKSNTIKRQRSSHSESSAYNYVEVEREEQKEDEKKDTSANNLLSGTTRPYRRRGTSISNDDATYSEDQFEENETFPYRAPKVSRSHGHKRTSSLPYVRDRDKNEEEILSTERNVHTRIHKNI